MSEVPARDFFYMLPLSTETKDDRLFMDRVIFRREQEGEETLKIDKLPPKRTLRKGSSPNQLITTNEEKRSTAGSDSSQPPSSHVRPAPYHRKSRPQKRKQPKKPAPGSSKQPVKQKDIVDDFGDLFIPLVQRWPELGHLKELVGLYDEVVATRNVAPSNNINNNNNNFNNSNNNNETPQDRPMMLPPICPPVQLLPIAASTTPTFMFVSQPYLPYVPPLSTVFSIPLYPGVPEPSVGFAVPAQSVPAVCELQTSPTSPQSNSAPSNQGFRVYEPCR